MSKQKWKKGVPVGPIESAYVIPPSMIRNLASDEVGSIKPLTSHCVKVRMIAELFV